MIKLKVIEERKCPKCKSAVNQRNTGFNKSGTQRCACKNCGITYTLNAKTRGYSEGVRRIAIREYYSGVSGRGVGKINRMNKANVYNLIKKPDTVWISQETEYSIFELDKLHWFINQKKPLDLRQSSYIMTMISRNPRQIVGFDVDNSILSSAIQAIVDSTEPAKYYCTDGLRGYLDVDFLGGHIYNTLDKSDTHYVASINSDLRHYIPILARKSKCFARSPETKRAVLAVFIDAYNKFGEAKSRWRIPVKHKSATPNKNLCKFKELPFSHLDFL